MHKLPFRDVQEAKENAKLLHIAFTFNSVYKPNSNEPFSLQQVHQLIANTFGHERWADLTKTLEVGYPVVYFNEDTYTEIKNAIAPRMADIIGDNSLVERIKSALSMTGFGYPLWRRNFLAAMLNPVQKLCKTLEQWQQLQQLEAGYAFATRYSRGMSHYRVRMLNYAREMKRAQILGLPKPRKPHRPKGESPDP